MSIDELVGGGPHNDYVPTNVCRGKIKRAPSDAADSMTVVLINFSEDYDYEVPGSNWMPRASLPTVGQSCVVLIDDDGDAWVPCYG
jgi:hypothetical protein